jgi:hypothetical protein
VSLVHSLSPSALMTNAFGVSSGQMCILVTAINTVQLSVVRSGTGILKLLSCVSALLLAVV